MQHLTFCLFVGVVSLLPPHACQAQAPNWTVDTHAYSGTMTVTGIIEINGAEAKSLENTVGVFVGVECRGVAKPIYNAVLDRYFIFLSVLGNEAPEKMTYKIYVGGEAKIYAGRDTLAYTLNAIYGKIDTPYVFRNIVVTGVDRDGDGYDSSVDCNDDNREINPGAIEILDNDIDENCDGVAARTQPVIRYLNNFDAASTDFSGPGFSITTPAGFTNPAIHSTHPYGHGFDTGVASFDFSYQLQIPIIVAPVNHQIRFQEIALVEPGDPDVPFGEQAFWDYVVVEAKKIKATTWTPLAPGYDCREQEAWLSAFMSGYNPNTYVSNTAGNPTMFRLRELDITPAFTPGDTILIRFRLFSDEYAYGWGWAIDDLEIQNEQATATRSLPGLLVFQVFPNPVSSDVVTVSLALQASQYPLTLRMHDVLGRLVYSAALPRGTSAFTEEIPLSGLGRGIYLLSISDGKGIATRRLVRH